MNRQARAIGRGYEAAHGGVDVVVQEGVHGGVDQRFELGRAQADANVQRGCLP